MLCKSCAHESYCDMAQFGGHVPPIRGCSKFKKKSATNADRIRAMTDEELAMLLGASTIVSQPWCNMNYDCPYIDQDPVRCDLCALEWLRREAE